MSRIVPDEVYRNVPCSIVSVGCAVGKDDTRVLANAKGLKDDGYLTLDSMNKYIRSLIPVQKKEVFRKGERLLLRDFLRGNKRKAIVCVLGHYVYVEGESYYSFFENDSDEVVCVWWIKEEPLAEVESF